MKEAASLGAARHGSVVYSSYQTAGRGRGRDRVWASTRGENLLFTVLVDPDRTVHPPVRIPLITALALEEMLSRHFGIESLLKWPNDILVHEKKISGILCEYRGGRILTGIGINVKQRQFSQEIRDRATSLALEGADCIEPSSLLESFLGYFKAKLETRSWKEEAESLLYGMGRIIEVLEGGTEEPRRLAIRILGLDDDGFLIAEDVNTGRRKQLRAGEISFPGFGDFR
jgi:BirA family biotin operon repressor/biotin-[acetyl-CoA-carboxylase] ligase